MGWCGGGLITKLIDDTYLSYRPPLDVEQCRDGFILSSFSTKFIVNA